MAHNLLGHLGNWSVVWKALQWHNHWQWVTTYTQPRHCNNSGHRLTFICVDTFVRTVSPGISEQSPASNHWTLVAQWEHHTLWMDASNRLSLNRRWMAQARTSIQVSWGCKALIQEKIAKAESNWFKRYWSHIIAVFMVHTNELSFIKGCFCSEQTFISSFIYTFFFFETKWLLTDCSHC